MKALDLTQGPIVRTLIAFTLPTLYRSSATILLEPSSIPADMVRTTVTSYADLQIDLVRRAALSSRGMEPCPGVPFVRAVTHAIPFCATPIG